MNEKILIVEEDDVLREAAQQALEQEGYQVATAINDQETFRWAGIFKPDLFLIDLDMRATSGWQLMTRLRSESRFALVPMVFLSETVETKDSAHSFHLGGDAYLRKPLRAEQLIDAVKETFATNQQTRATADKLRGGTFLGIEADGVTFHGSIDELGLATLLNIMELEKLEGILVVRRREFKERGRFIVRNGRMLQAQILDQEDPRGIDAVCHMMNWTTGDFEFRAGPLDETDEIKMTTTQVLIEAARRLDESGR